MGHKRNAFRPSFEPNTEPWAPNTVEEQKEDHKRYWDEQHDIELANKLSDAIRREAVDILTGSESAREALLEIVRELRLTTY